MANKLKTMNLGDVTRNDSQSTNRIAECGKIQLPENISAYLEKRELVRDFEEVVCDSELKDNVMNNYIIVKRILSNLSWRDKLICKLVCTTWHSAVLALQKEQLNAVDFVVDMPLSQINKGPEFIASENFHSEPLAVMTFLNDSGILAANTCTMFLPSPCDPPCEKLHCLLDYVQHQVTAPKPCILSVRANYISYRPLSDSVTSESTITKRLLRKLSPMASGVFIPIIPDVQFHVLNIGTNTDMNVEYYDVISQLSKDSIFKGVLIYVTEKFIVQSFIETCNYLNYFKEIQPDVPFALGGCIVEDTLEQSDTSQLVEAQEGYHTNNFVSENLITIAMFTVPKTYSGNGEKCHFDMYSLVIESPEWSKVKIQTTINEFAKKVPRFEHSIVLKLACVGRDQKHDIEEELFRAAFPYTRLVGCYGNGELGINHPARDPPLNPNPKKLKKESQPTLDMLYSYSTVFVYIGWGKMTPASS